MFSTPTDAYIYGTWRAAKTGKRFLVTNPAYGAVVAEVADCDAADAEDAVAAADQAQVGWAAKTAGERARLLTAWRDAIVAQVDDLAALLTAEMGKPLAEAKGEIMYGASYLEWFAEEAKRIYGDTIPSNSPGNRIVVIKQPVGVCATITPWNFPNAMLLRKAAPALAAGCTLVSKPAEDTPLSALALAQLAGQVGIPAGVFNVVPSTNPREVGEVLTRSPLVRKISFTGSTEVGRSLLEQSASTIKKVSMELGGNAPFIIFEDANLDAAIAGLMASKYRNAGQTCVCANRVFVHRSILDDVAARLAEKVQALKVAPGDQDGAEIGPLINKDAIDKVEQLLKGALDAGAELVTGGTRHNAGELFFTPTVIKNVSPDMEIMQEEIFGPVTPIIAFDDEDEVIRLANDTIHGLASYFYTNDLGRAWRVGEALEYGMVGINEGLLSNAAAPFGGVKQSGMGREGSRYGLDDYLETKYMLMGGLGRTSA